MRGRREEGKEQEGGERREGEEKGVSEVEGEEGRTDSRARRRS